MHKFCRKEINIKTYKEHRRLYFDVTSKSWLVGSTTVENARESDSSDSSLFSSTPDPSDSDADDDMNQVDLNLDVTPVVTNTSQTLSSGDAGSAHLEG